MKDTFKNISLEKQKKIIDKAFEEFAENGYKNASTNQLVKKIGISKGSLFKYFQGKLDLYHYLVNLSLEHLLDYMNAFTIDPNESINKQILSYAAYEYDYLINYPTEYIFFYRLIKELNHPELSVIREEITSKSFAMGQVFFESLGIADIALINHLQLIVFAYNQSFMEGISIDSDWKGKKDLYLSGLEKHLNYVDWRHNESLYSK